MLTVAALGPAELAARLAGDGLHLRTAGFSVCLRSRIDSVARGIGLLYADYPLLAADDFADFRLSLERPAGARRWFKPQVRLLYDGNSLFQPLPLAQAFPMFEWGLNWCVSSRANEYLIVHAAVVEKHGCAAILPAPPGSGKSTLCAALVGRGGWRLLSDELTLVRLADGALVPLPRPVSLKNGSIAVIRDYLGDAVLSPAVRDTVKGTVAHLKAPADSVARAAETARAAWLVFPQYRAGAAVRLDALSRAQSFMRVAGNSFNYSLLGRRGFDALGRVVDASAGYALEYGRLDDALALFERLAGQRLAERAA